MRTAVLSDIHGNLEALEAVLADVDAVGVDRVVCLGDVIDYGPDPRACLERITAIASIVLVGNHEEEAVVPSEMMETFVDEILQWSLAQLEGCDAWEALAPKLAAGRAQELASVVDGDCHFVHAAGDAPTQQYIWPAHEIQYLLYNDQVDERLREFLDAFQRPHGFCGHTHVPAILTDYHNHGLFDPYRGDCDHDRRRTFIGPKALFFVPQGDRCRVEGLAGCRVVINPGSVGQPRRVGDNRASWAFYDGDCVEVRRVAYRWKRTVRKIGRLPISKPLKKFLTERLASGI